MKILVISVFHTSHDTKESKIEDKMDYNEFYTDLATIRYLNVKGIFSAIYGTSSREKGRILGKSQMGKISPGTLRKRQSCKPERR